MKLKYMKSKYIKLFSLLLCLPLLISCSHGKNSPDDIIKTTVEVNKSASSTSNPAGSREVTGSDAPDSSDQANMAASSDLITYTTEDYYTDWADQNPNFINLSGNYGVLKGSGADIKYKAITIYDPGVYVISGTFEGQISVALKNQGFVQLVLNGVELNSTEKSPVFIDNAEKALLSLPEGTNNIISYTKQDNNGSSQKISDAAIFSRKNLTINGPGSLTVNGYNSSGILCNDILKMTDGKITVTSDKDGMTGVNMLAVIGGTLNITAKGNGIKSNNTSDPTKGSLILDGGNFIITSGKNGMKAGNSIWINDGVYTLITGKKKSTKGCGILTVSDITINGGSFTIDSSGDTLHCGNSLTINGGEMALASAKAGIQADSTLHVTNGTISISKCRTGMISRTITILDGSISITALENGMVITDRIDSSSAKDSTKDAVQSNTDSLEGENSLTMNGGYLVIDSSRYGIYTCGSVDITDGTLLVNGSADKTCSAVNYRDKFHINGGLVVTADNTDGLTAPSEDSTQHTVIYEFKNTKQANTLFSIQNRKGESILAFAPKKKFKSVVISSPDLKAENIYALYLGGNITLDDAKNAEHAVSGDGKDGFYAGGKYKNGHKVIRFQVTDLITTVTK